MSRAPIDALLDKVAFKCTRCGKPQSENCGCWEKVMLRCPQCKRTMKVSRDTTDPVGTAVVEFLCDRCDDGGGFPETHYYDADGQWFDGEKFCQPQNGPGT